MPRIILYSRRAVLTWRYTDNEGRVRVERVGLEQQREGVHLHRHGISPEEVAETLRRKLPQAPARKRPAATAGPLRT